VSSEPPFALCGPTGTLIADGVRCRYGDAAALFRQGISRYREDVSRRTYPRDDESYHLPREAAETSSRPEAELVKA